MITTATSSTRAVSGNAEIFPKPGGQLGKEEFLQLLVTQLRYQDPLNPMQAEDFATQLAQFSSVEQLMNLNDRLEAQIANGEALAQGFNTTAALGVLGQTVLASVDQVVVPESGDGSVMVEVEGAGGTAVLRLYDEQGNEVGSGELGSLAAGRHTLELGEAAESLPPGVYSCEIEVTDSDGEPVAARTLASARVDGIRYGANGPVLIAGSLEIPLSSVLEVTSQS